MNRDSIVHAIFMSLFGRLRRTSSGDPFHHDDEDEVDEDWIKNSLHSSLFTSKALDFACSTTRGTDILYRYIDDYVIYCMINELRFEDDRIPTAR